MGKESLWKFFQSKSAISKDLKWYTQHLVEITVCKLLSLVVPEAMTRSRWFHIYLSNLFLQIVFSSSVLPEKLQQVTEKNTFHIVVRFPWIHPYIIWREKGHTYISLVHVALPVWIYSPNIHCDMLRIVRKTIQRGSLNQNRIEPISLDNRLVVLPLNYLFL